MGPDMDYSIQISGCIAVLGRWPQSSLFESIEIWNIVMEEVCKSSEMNQSLSSFNSNSYIVFSWELIYKDSTSSIFSYWY